MNRGNNELYPDYSGFIEEIEEHGITPKLLYKIIQKHRPNAKYNKKLYDRYIVLKDGVPIFSRGTHYNSDEINNKINNDFFGEIVDFKAGYFAGKPIAYGYSKTEESISATGGELAVEQASKKVTDFVTRSNMYGVDMNNTLFSGIYGYSGRLFYIDKDGNERVMAVHGYETIILSNTEIHEPQYAIRYYETSRINGSKYWVVEFYDNTDIITYVGSLSNLNFKEKKPHMFSYCPLQGIANNVAMMGDAEKVLAEIDDYDKGVSDNSNEIEAFVHAYLIFENLRIDEEKIETGKKSGSFVFPSTGTGQGKAYFLTKDINDAFTEHHLKRTEDNIYRFSKTPNLNDESFGSSSGVSLRFKLHGLETKCGMFQTQVMNAAQYMWKLLASAWEKRGVIVDPLQCTMEFKRNFPLDTLSEAQTVQALTSSGIPKEVAFSQLSFVDDVEYIMDMIEQEKSDITPLTSTENEDNADKMLDAADTGTEKLSLLNGAQIQALTGIVQNVQNGVLSRNAAITMAVSALGISRENAEAIIEEKLN